ncbi:MAG: hypothetical protein HC787_05740 [Nostocaceae cyanobacterium CSU_2_110]|nr:hypothetical protein [Nostocaceae cyanobacterium CSU_2_110]
MKASLKLRKLSVKLFPSAKIGNLGTVLKDDLKKYAQKERENRYCKTLSLISGRLARYTVDKNIDGQSLLQSAASAICAYGVMTFKSLDAIKDIKAQFDSVVEQVKQVQGARSEDITIKENVMGTKDITRIKPTEEEVEVECTEWRPEEKTETIEEEVDVPVERTAFFPQTVEVRGIVDVTKPRSWLGKLWTGEDTYTEQEVGNVERSVIVRCQYIDSEKQTREKEVNKN